MRGGRRAALAVVMGAEHEAIAGRREADSAAGEFTQTRTTNSAQDVEDSRHLVGGGSVEQE